MEGEEVLAECRFAGIDLVEQDPVRVGRIDTDVELAALRFVAQRLHRLLKNPVEKRASCPALITNLTTTQSIPDLSAPERPLQVLDLCRT